MTIFKSKRRYDMAIKCIVVDKNGKTLSDVDLNNKIIDNPRYYDIVLPIRKRINNELFRQDKK